MLILIITAILGMRTTKQLFQDVTPRSSVDVTSVSQQHVTSTFRMQTEVRCRRAWQQRTRMGIIETGEKWQRAGLHRKARKHKI